MKKERLKIEWIVMLLIFSTLENSAQNLISNPGFEKCDLCGRFGNPGVEFSFLNGANNPVDWFGVTEGSSDIRSTYPYKGKRHGGFFSFGKFEYLGNVLNEPLQAGAEYKFSFWLAVELSGGYSLDEIGVYFQKSLPQYKGLPYLGKVLTPQFTTPDGEYLPSDKYKQYSFIYKACGGEDHLIIGRFTNLGKNDTLYIGQGKPTVVYPYTYVDDVELIKIKDAPNLLEDQIEVCQNQVVRIGIAPGYFDVLWSTGAKTDSIDVNSNGGKIYVEVKLNDNCPPIRDSILIVFKPKVDDQANLIKEDTICFIKGKEIDVTNIDYNSYIWNNGSKVPKIIITEPGTYSVTASSNCNLSTDQVVIVGSDLNKFIQFPNVFTPLSTENNKFAPIIQTNMLDSITSYHLRIYNRWGKKVFEIADPKLSWIPESNEPAETYFFQLEYEVLFCDEKKQNVVKGSVNLIR